jgi:hypothetical protein
MVVHAHGPGGWAWYFHYNNTTTTPLRSGCWLHSTGVLNTSHFWVMTVHIMNTSSKKKLTEENQIQIFTHSDIKFCNLCILSLWYLCSCNQTFQYFQVGTYRTLQMKHNKQNKLQIKYNKVHVRQHSLALEVIKEKPSEIKDFQEIS